MASTAFPDFDSLTGGLTPGDGHLLYGPAGTGKTAFALGFLYRGIREGEPTLMVTAASPQSALLQARAFGFDLDEAVRDGRLIIFEYPENIRDNAERLMDDGRMAEELLSMLGGRSVRRVVFDPISPLLASTLRESSSARLRELQRGLQERGATALYLVDTPDGESCLRACRDAISNVLRFEHRAAPGDPAKLIRLERFRGHDGLAIPFTLSPHSGFTHAQAAHLEPHKPAAQLMSAGPSPLASRPHLLEAAGWTPLEPRVLVLEPDKKRRATLQAIFDGGFEVIEAQSAADALMLASAEAAGLIVMNTGLRGATGAEVTRRLRNSGFTQPIVAIGEKLRRPADRVEMLLAGADACFPIPLDGRLLRLTALQLLSRHTPANSSIEAADPEGTLSPARDTMSCTSDSGYFLERVEHEIHWAGNQNVPFHVVMIRTPGAQDMEALASASVLITRHSDVTLVGPRGLIVLLTEAATAESYLCRFRRRWTASQDLIVDTLRFECQAGFGDHVRDYMARVGPAAAAAASAAN